MLLVKYLIILLLLVSPNGKGYELTWPTAESTCYWDNTSNDQECGKNKKIEVIFRNGSVSGVVIAEVILPPKSCKNPKFAVILVRKVKLEDNTHCSINGVGYRHSWKNFRRVECESDKCPNICGKIAKFTFYHVNSGQYYLVVRKYYSDGGTNDYEFPFNITTNFTDSWATEIINEKPPNIARKTVNFNFTFTRPTSLVIISLQHQNYTQVEKILLNSSNIEPMKNICNITQEIKESRNIGKMTGISCALRNANERAYKLDVEYSNEDNCDDETRIDSKFSERDAECACWQTKGYDIDPEMENESDSPLLIAVLVTLVFVIAGLALLILLRNHNHNLIGENAFSGETVSIPLVINTTEILLLYPRDCPQFMELMKSLKILLETSYQLQVYDCYDAECAEVLNGPEEWFQSIMHHTGLRTIIVTTQCGYIQHEAVLSNTKCQYEQPHFLDHLFMYGLSQIKREFSEDVYQKIYIVQISGFSDDVELRFLPTTFTKYKLPDHLEKLCTAMNVICQAEVSNHHLLKGDGYTGFMNSLEELKIFKTRNKYYLDQMLKISMESSPCF